MHTSVHPGQKKKMDTDNIKKSVPVFEFAGVSDALLGRFKKAANEKFENSVTCENSKYSLSGELQHFIIKLAEEHKFKANALTAKDFARVIIPELQNEVKE